MRKFFILPLLFAVSLSVLATSDFDKGQVLYNEQQYVEADSIFTLIIEDFPFGEAYYNRALCRQHMGDMKGYCEDLQLSFSYEASDAQRLHACHCLAIDTLYYDSTFRKVLTPSVYKEVIKKERYSTVSTGDFYTQDNKKIASYELVNQCKCFKLIPNMPAFKGGQEEMRRFLRVNLTYPSCELDACRKYAGTCATVYVQFEVSKSGEVQRVQLEKSRKLYAEKYISPHFIKEALRVVASMPDFDTAQFMGQAVVVNAVLPITFKFDEQ